MDNSEKDIRKIRSINLCQYIYTRSVYVSHFTVFRTWKNTIYLWIDIANGDLKSKSNGIIEPNIFDERSTTAEPDIIDKSPTTVMSTIFD